MQILTTLHFRSGDHLRRCTDLRPLQTACWTTNYWRLSTASKRRAFPSLWLKKKRNVRTTASGDFCIIGTSESLEDCWVTLTCELNNLTFNSLSLTPLIQVFSTPRLSGAICVPFVNPFVLRAVFESIPKKIVSVILFPTLPAVR